jgi:amino acid transporter
LNYRGIRSSGLFQDVATFGLLGFVVLFLALGFARGSPANVEPLFARAGTVGGLLSVLFVLQVVPYFLTGFESIGKESEEARTDFDPRHFRRAIVASLTVGFLFYASIVAAVAFVFPWKELVAGHLGTEAAFERAFSSRLIARAIVFAAFLSLLKIFNGNFVAATRLLFGLGRRNLVHPALARVQPAHGTPVAAIVLMAVLTTAAAFLGDALLVPVSEVGSLAVGVGWLATCAAFLRRRRGIPKAPGRAAAVCGAAVSLAIVAMKVLPGIPGSFTRAEWIAFAAWSCLGAAFWLSRRRSLEN